MKDIPSYKVLSLKSSTYFGSEWILDQDLMKEVYTLLDCDSFVVGIPRQKTMYCCKLEDAMNPSITPSFVEFVKVRK